MLFYSELLTCFANLLYKFQKRLCLSSNRFKLGINIRNVEEMIVFKIAHIPINNCFCFNGSNYIIALYSISISFFCEGEVIFPPDLIHNFKLIILCSYYIRSKI